MGKDWTKWLKEQGIEVKPYTYIPYQREWQREKKAIGLCVSCGNNRIHFLSKCRCESCLIKQRKARNKYAIKNGLIKGLREKRGGKPRLTGNSNDLNKDANNESSQCPQTKDSGTI